MGRRRGTAKVRGPTARFTGPFRFFDLPRELRDLVYDEVWPTTNKLYRATVYHLPSPLIDITSTYPQRTDSAMSSTYYPPWVRVSRSFLSEAMDRFFWHSGWVARIPASYFTTRLYLSSTSQLKDSKFHLDLERSALTWGSKTVGWIPNADYSRSVLEVYKAWPMDLPVLKKLEQGLRGPGGLRTLYISFGIIPSRTKRVTAVDLSGLEAIGFKVDKIVFDITCTKGDTKFRERLRNLIEEEAARLGRAMIGQPVTCVFGTRNDIVTGDGPRWVFKLKKA